MFGPVHEMQKSFNKNRSKKKSTYDKRLKEGILSKDDPKNSVPNKLLVKELTEQERHEIRAETLELNKKRRKKNIIIFFFVAIPFIALTIFLFQDFGLGKSSQEMTLDDYKELSPHIIYANDSKGKKAEAFVDQGESAFLEERYSYAAQMFDHAFSINQSTQIKIKFWRASLESCIWENEYCGVINLNADKILGLDYRTVECFSLKARYLEETGSISSAEKYWELVNELIKQENNSE